MSNGINGFFQYTGTVVPILYPLILIMVFLVIAVGGYSVAISKGKEGNLPGHFAAAGFITSIIATVMSFIPLINLPTLATTYGISIMCILWLFFSGE